MLGIWAILQSREFRRQDPRVVLVGLYLLHLSIHPCINSSICPLPIPTFHHPTPSQLIPSLQSSYPVTLSIPCPSHVHPMSIPVHPHPSHPTPPIPIHPTPPTPPFLHPSHYPSHYPSHHPSLRPFHSIPPLPSPPLPSPPIPSSITSSIPSLPSPPLLSSPLAC